MRRFWLEGQSKQKRIANTGEKGVHSGEGICTHSHRVLLHSPPPRLQPALSCRAPWLSACSCVCARFFRWHWVHLSDNASVRLLSRTRSDQILAGKKLKQHKPHPDVVRLNPSRSSRATCDGMAPARSDVYRDENTFAPPPLLLVEASGGT